MEDTFSVEEKEFQAELSELFSFPSVHESLCFVDHLVEKFLVLKEKYSHTPQKRNDLLAQLQLLKGKNSSLMERCFADDDALAHFFALHEKITALHENLINYVPPDNENENCNNIDSSSVEIGCETKTEQSEDETEEIGGLFECPICFMDVSYAETRKLADCQHRYCVECLSCYYNSIINDGGDVTNISCPDPCCDGFVIESDIRSVVDTSTMEKYERFLLLSFLKNEPNAHWCPYPNCDNAMITDDGQERVRCDKCYRSSCVKCKTVWHPNMTCEESKASQEPEDPKTLKWKRKHGVKACPFCGQETIRISGCPDMLCSNCKSHWNWFSVGEARDETWIEKAGYYYPRTMKRVLGSRDVLEDWKKDKRGTALYLTPFMVASTVIGIPVFCVTGPPAYITKKVRSHKKKSTQ